MKRYLWILVMLLLSAIPALAQDPAEDALRDLGMMGSYALGDLALRSATGLPNDPVARLRDFFVEAKQPLSKPQEKRLQAIVDAQLSATQGANGQAAPTSDEMRRKNREYFAQVIGVLTVDQQTTWRKYQVQQIKLRGGFEALKLTLEEAKVPLTPDQEKQVESIYDTFNKQGVQVVKGTSGQPDMVKLNQMQREQIAKVIKLLTPDQRKALAASKAEPKG
jgi:hypothetical protein